MNKTDLLNKIVGLPTSDGRQMVAIAGPPASGKSFLAEWLATELNHSGQAVKVIPMDGFHLDNRLLEQRGLLNRKGAPETFDAAGFVHLVERIKHDGTHIYPLFDRARDIAIAGAEEISEACRLVIFEGNYLLFDQEPWQALNTMWDLSVWLATPQSVTRERCVQRWLDHGLSQDDAILRAEQNDVKNAQLINRCNLPAHVTLHEGDW
ncbi:MAG: nucleoside/nucleotide kinase family protein [Pseudomonadota bacterium]